MSEIEAGTFGNVYRGSSLEVVVGSIAEQRQIFKGAEHAFLWKPKLRIPDIYENPGNQHAFAAFLDTCACCSTAGQVISVIRRLDAVGVKGLGPAAANLVYFLHPTLVPPFNTAIVNGALTGARVNLGKWEEFLAMRAGILELNAPPGPPVQRSRYCRRPAVRCRHGAVPSAAASRRWGARAAWEADLARVREESAKEARGLATAREGDRSHTEVQGWLRDLGHALGYEVWIAANDRSRPWGPGVLGKDAWSACPPRSTQRMAPTRRA